MCTCMNESAHTKMKLSYAMCLFGLYDIYDMCTRKHWQNYSYSNL